MAKKIWVLTTYNHDTEERTIECAFTHKLDAQEEMMNRLKQEIGEICECEGIEPPTDFEVNDTDKYVYGSFGDYDYGFKDNQAFVDFDFNAWIDSVELIEGYSDDEEEEK